MAFIFQETVLFVASGLLLLVAVVLLLLQAREQFRKKNRLKLPTELTPEDELKARGILDVRPKSSTPSTAESAESADSGIEFAPAELAESDLAQQLAVSAELPSGDGATDEPLSGGSASKDELLAAGIVEIRTRRPRQKTLFDPEAESRPEPASDSGKKSETQTEQEPDAGVEPEFGHGADSVGPSAPRRRVDVDAHLPALQRSLGAHTACLVDVDTEACVYRLRSIVSNGAVDDAGTEYPFSGFFLSDLLAETSVLDYGTSMGIIRSNNGLKKVVAAPVIVDGMPAAFFVAAFESDVDEGGKEAVSSAGEFFSSLYGLLGDEPTAADSPLSSARREREPLRLVKSNPRSAQRRIIAEEMNRARGKARPLALALVCLDSNSDITTTDETTIHQVEAWMRDCLEEVTPDGRVEYFGELGYGILQTRDVTDVEGWVRRAQVTFANKNCPIKAFPIVGVAMLSDEHSGPDDLQADAFKALRAAYECGDSTILVG